MAGWLGSVFGKDPGKLLENAERFAGLERWPEAIDSLEKALAHASRGKPGIDAVIRRRLREYSDAYVTQMEQAIPLFLEDGNREKAEEFAEIAITFTEDESRRTAIRGLLARAKPAKKPPAPPPRPEKYADELIDSLLYGYLESLEPEEREQVEKRPLAFQRAFVYWHQGEPEEARRAAEDHLSKAIDDPWGHLYLGLSLASLDLADEAARAFEAAAGLDPSLLPATLGLAAMERQRGNGDRALELLDKATKTVRAHPDRFGEKRRDDVFQTTLQVLAESGRHKWAGELYGELRREGLIPLNLAFEARLAEARGDLGGAAARWDTLLGSRSGGAGGSITGHGFAGGAAGPADHEEAADFFHRAGEGKRAFDLYQKAALHVTDRIHFHDEESLMPHLFRLKKKIALLSLEIGRPNEARAIADELAGLDEPPPELDEIRRAIAESP
ncbi:MAG: hypothetical protein ABIK65_02585 [Candidatus Eisenbacteria bacterium]